MAYLDLLLRVGAIGLFIAGIFLLVSGVKELGVYIKKIDHAFRGNAPSERSSAAEQRQTTQQQWSSTSETQRGDSPP